MGFGISMGPRLFRVRVSTRGLGISSGVGPVSIYANSGYGRRRNTVISPRGEAPGSDTAPAHLPVDSTTIDLTGAGARQLTPTGSDELAAQLNRAQRWITGWGWAVAVCAFLSFAAPLFLIPMAAALIVAVVGFARRRVVLHYEVDSELSEWFNGLAAGWPEMTRTSGAWRVQTNTRLNRTHDKKMNAGASDLVARHALSFPSNLPVALKANVAVPTVAAKGHSLLFLPDRLLVKSGAEWSDVDYNHLHVTVGRTRFVESGTVPRDGVQVGETWQYTNVKGGPDRRFKNNRRLPVMGYAEITFSSPGGLGWFLQLSRHDAAAWWQQALRNRPRTPSLTSTPLPDDPISPPPQPEPASVAPAPRRTSTSKNEHVPPRPAGRPLEPWGRPWRTIEVAGESHHRKAISALFTGVPAYVERGGAESHTKAVLVPDPHNPHGEAVAVFVRGNHIGYLPHDTSTTYHPHVAAMTAQGAAVTVSARVWACENESGFQSRVTLSVPAANDFRHPESMPADDNAILLPYGNALQVTGEEEHIGFLLPYLGKNIAVTLHNVTLEKAGKPLHLVEIRLVGRPVGRFIRSTSAKVGPLVNRVERAGGVPVARATVSGNSLKVDVAVYVARAADVPQNWLDDLSPLA